MISSEVFHRIPMNKNFGTYPENLKFDDFKLDYEQDLAELNSREKFIYTNSTSTKQAICILLKFLQKYCKQVFELQDHHNHN